MAHTTHRRRYVRLRRLSVISHIRTGTIRCPFSTISCVTSFTGSHPARRPLRTGNTNGSRTGILMEMLAGWIRLMQRELQTRRMV